MLAMQKRKVALLAICFIVAAAWCQPAQAQQKCLDELKKVASQRGLKFETGGKPEYPFIDILSSSRKPLEQIHAAADRCLRSIADRTERIEQKGVPEGTFYHFKNTGCLLFDLGRRGRWDKEEKAKTGDFAISVDCKTS